MTDKETGEGVEEVIEDLRTEGVRAAYDALVEVCRDGKAPAPARATAGTSLFRAAGLFDRKEGGGSKELHEMDGNELRRHLANLEAEHRALKRGGLRGQSAVDGDQDLGAGESDVFG